MTGGGRWSAHCLSITCACKSNQHLVWAGLSQLHACTVRFKLPARSTSLQISTSLRPPSVLTSHALRASCLGRSTRSRWARGVHARSVTWGPCRGEGGGAPACHSCLPVFKTDVTGMLQMLEACNHLGFCARHLHPHQHVDSAWRGKAVYPVNIPNRCSYCIRAAGCTCSSTTRASSLSAMLQPTVAKCILDWNFKAY
jgi:hypothetical protein